MRFAIFVAGLVWLVNKLRQDPSWAPVAAAYFYFAIPSREFFAPAAPYQAGLWALGLLATFRHPALLATRLEAELRDQLERVAAQVRDAWTSALVEIVVRGKTTGLTEDAIHAEARRRFDQVLHEQLARACPARLLDVARDGLDRTFIATYAAALAEASRVLAIDAGRQVRGALVAAMTAQVDAIVRKSIADNERGALERALLQSEVDYDQLVRAKDPKETGPLGIPLPPPAIAAVFSNPGLYFHVWFTLATYVSAGAARWSKYHAELQIGVCWLLFIPMLGISGGLRHISHWQRFSWAWLLGVVHLAYNGIVLWMKFGGRADNVGGQAGDANWLGIICVSMASVGLGMFVGHKDWLTRLAGLAGAGFCALGVIACGSRGALVALVIAVGYWFMWTNKKGIAVGLIALGAAGFLAAAPTEFWDRMGTMFLGKESNPWIVKTFEPSARSRQIFWDVAIDAFKESPLIGIGPMNFPKENAERALYVDSQGFREFMTHSTWLQLLCEYGLFGSIPWYLGYLVAFACVVRATLLARALRDDAQLGWLYSYLVGFQAGWVGCGVAISFVSSQWLDFTYWIMVFGPLTLRLVQEAVAERAWFVVAPATVKRPPPRYTPPTSGGLDLDRLERVTAAEPTLGGASLAPGR
jgi:O-antigen ligase